MRYPIVISVYHEKPGERYWRAYIVSSKEELPKGEIYQILATNVQPIATIED